MKGRSSTEALLPCSGFHQNGGNPAPSTPRRRSRVRSTIGVVAALVLAAGCSTTPKPGKTERNAVYEQAGVHYEYTILIKPADSDRPEYALGPLLMQEIQSEEELSRVPYTIYFWQTRARGMGTVLDQRNYLWFHSTDDPDAKIPQGVRITYNRENMPVIWEPLQPGSKARVLYVAQSLEAFAMTNYPGRFPERRFWVERSLSETPDTLVARILDDGPEPMGPIVYLRGGTHEIDTVICRCMDAQADEVGAMGAYGLATVGDAPIRWLTENGKPNLLRWLPGKAPDDFDAWLRLPTE